MILLGLAGHAGAGKDTVADYLVTKYGFVKFSFSDALYREVAAAYGLESEDLLRDRDTKDTPQSILALENCNNAGFVAIATDELEKRSVISAGKYQSLSPRQVLQLWGTEYRRALDANYWVQQAEDWIAAVWGIFQYPEQRPQFFVNTSVRFPNERAWVRKFQNGNVWHIRRAGLTPVNSHVSETPLEVLDHERELFNNDTVDRLYKGVELLLSTQAKFVRVEPMLVEEPSALGHSDNRLLTSTAPLAEGETFNFEPGDGSIDVNPARSISRMDCAADSDVPQEK
jgi:hypothetical protein